MTLEELLEELIERWWKPFWRDARDIDEIIIERLDRMGCYQDMDYISFMRFDDRRQESFVKYGCSIRDLVSKSSWLWQFVCENGMVKSIWSEIEIKNLNEWYWVVRDTDYQYWFIVSSLKDESELEQFLLDNIKVE